MTTDETRFRLRQAAEREGKPSSDFDLNLTLGWSLLKAGGVPANFIARWDGSAWHPLGLGLHPYAGEELPDVGDHGLGLHPGQVLGPRPLDQPAPRDVLGEVPAALDRHGQVTGAVEDERRNADTREDRPDVDLTGGELPGEGLSGTGGVAEQTREVLGRPRRVVQLLAEEADRPPLGRCSPVVREAGDVQVHVGQHPGLDGAHRLQPADRRAAIVVIPHVADDDGQLVSRHRAALHNLTPHRVASGVHSEFLPVQHQLAHDSPSQRPLSSV